MATKLLCDVSYYKVSLVEANITLQCQHTDTFHLKHTNHLHIFSMEYDVSYLHRYIIVRYIMIPLKNIGCHGDDRTAKKKFATYLGLTVH